MRTNFLLILGLCAVNLQKTLVDDICYEKDKALVDVDVLYDDHCVDIEGVIYSLGSELASCCNCFRLVSSENLGNFNRKGLRKLIYNSATNVRSLTAGTTI